MAKYNTSIYWDDYKDDENENEDDENKDDENKEEIKDEIPPDCGVCDSEMQFWSKYPNFIGRVDINPIYRSEQPSSYGWRWHKWGPYIGNYNIRGIEYLYEANGMNGKPKIDVQYIFNIISRRPLGF